jgi:hypothetical protein
MWYFLPSRNLILPHATGYYLLVGIISGLLSTCCLESEWNAILRWELWAAVLQSTGDRYRQLGAKHAGPAPMPVSGLDPGPAPDTLMLAKAIQDFESPPLLPSRCFFSQDRPSFPWQAPQCVRRPFFTKVFSENLYP